MKKLLLSLMLLLCPLSAYAAERLVVGTESTYPPFEMRDSDGRLVGFDIDFAKMVGEKLGLEVEFSDMSFDGLIPALMTGKINMVAAGLTVTEDRAKVIDFSPLYFQSTDSVLSLLDSGISSSDDLQGQTLGVQLGTTQDLRFSKISGLTVRRYSKVDDALADLTLGRIRAVALDSVVAADVLKSTAYKDKLAVAFTLPSEGDGFALGLSKKDPELNKKVKEAVEQLLREGALDDLRKKWIDNRG